MILNKQPAENAALRQNKDTAGSLDGIYARAKDLPKGECQSLKKCTRMLEKVLLRPDEYEKAIKTIADILQI